ncbi:anthranilate synthase component I [Halopenitus persicus]|uniref:Anthranilate synthase component 1 n=1 Tax=Halopenitus persicus TaxID=1048396 RepID=A0A1H3EQS5_9EURY|nr:anthranilate synthase, component I [Halopenitus persicus]
MTSRSEPADRLADPPADLDPSLSREAFVDHVADADGPAVVRIAVELDVDVSPLTASAALADRSDHGFLLESAEKVASSDPDGAFAPGTDADRHARYSFVGYDPEAVLSVYPDRTDLTRLGPAADLLAEPADADVSSNGDGIGPDAGDVLDRVRGAFPNVERRGFPETDRQTLSGGFVGFLAYDAVYDLWLEEVGVDRPEPVGPDAEFCLTTRTLVFDEVAGTVDLVLTPVVTPDDDPGAVYDDRLAEAAGVRADLRDAADPEPGGFTGLAETADPQAAYEAAVRTTKERVLDGEVYQGVISRTRELYGDVDPMGLYDALREINPSPYMYLLRHGDRSIVGASPETLVSVQGDRVVSNPIAGTCSRGESPVEDRRLAGEMLADEKERAEHTMLVDLARNDVRRVSAPGSVRVEEFMNVLKYSHVQHIESTVTGTLAADADAFDATRATFPAGTLTGAPKVRAMEIIDELERSPRGVYGGGVGYYSWTGDADFAIVIRTATIDHGVPMDAVPEVEPDAAPSENGTTDRGATDRGTTDRITIQAGAGLVADSVPEAEYEETEQKMDGVRAAVETIRETGGDADR